MNAFITVALEGKVDLAVVERVLDDFDVQLASVHGMKGKDHLRKSLPGYNRAAERSHWTVLMDLDQDATCAPEFARECLPTPARFMCLQIAVHEIEAWLLADASQFSRFLGIPVSQISPNPEKLPNPKRAVIDLARQSKRDRIRKALVPRPGSGREVGPAYESYMRDFAQTRWRPTEAELRAPSLRRYRKRLKRLQGVAI